MEFDLLLAAIEEDLEAIQKLQARNQTADAADLLDQVRWLIRRAMKEQPDNPDVERLFQELREAQSRQDLTRPSPEVTSVIPLPEEPQPQPATAEIPTFQKPAPGAPMPTPSIPVAAQEVPAPSTSAIKPEPTPEVPPTPLPVVEPSAPLAPQSTEITLPMQRSGAEYSREAEKHLALAEQRQTEGLAGEAAAEFVRALSLEPDYVEARITYARFLDQRGQHMEAIEQWRQASQRDPAAVAQALKNTVTAPGTAPELKLLYAISLYQEQPGSAKSVIATLLEEPLSNTDLLLQAAGFYLEHNEPLSADPLIERVLQNDPASIGAQKLKVKLLEYEQDFDGALELLAGIQQADPNSQISGEVERIRELEEALNQRYLTIALAGRRERQWQLDIAEGLYKEANAAEPILYDAVIYYIGYLLRQGREDEAVAQLRIMGVNGRTAFVHRFFKKAIDGRPKDRELARVYAAFLDLTGHTEEAIDLLESRIATGQDDAATLTQVGELLYSVGKLTDARAYLDRAIEAQPDKLQAFQLLGHIWSKLQSSLSFERQEFVQALQYYDRYEQLGGHEAETLQRAEEIRQQLATFHAVEEALAKAWYRLYRQEDVAGAEESFQEALKLSPESPMARLEYATFLRGQGQYRQAERVSTQVYQESSDVALEHYHRLLNYEEPQDQARAYAGLADLSLWQNNAENAAKQHPNGRQETENYLVEAIRLDPTMTYPRLMQIRFMLDASQLNEARNALRQLPQLDQDAYARGLLSQVYALQQRWEEAQMEIVAIQRMPPPPVPPKNANQEEIDLANRFMHRLEEQNEKAIVNMALGNFYRQRGNLDKALIAFQAALNDFPAHLETLQEYADLLENELHQNDNARQMWDVAYNTDDENIEVLNRGAAFWERVGDAEHTHDWRERAVSLQAGVEA